MKFDTVVIGAGPGGYVCAIRLSQLGKKVAVVEKHKLGGECLNYGCIPSKALIFASSLYEKALKNDFGVEVSGAKMNMDKLQTFRSNLVSKLTQGVGFLLKQNRVEVISGEASFSGAHTVSVQTSEGKKEIEADNFVLATGSRPIEIPGFEYDGDKVIGYREALETKDIPKSLIILGGGVIGLELGTYFVKLGTKVSVVEMMPQVLPGVDRDMVMVVQKSLEKRGMEIFTQAKATKLDKGSGVTLTVEHEGKTKKISGDKLLVSIGRRGNSDKMNLSAVGVEVDDKGFVKVNDNLETSAPHIYAIGDLVGQPLLAHKASHEGLQVADAIKFGAHRIVHPISWAIFTDPEIAGVGLTREQAKEQGIDVKVGKFPFVALGRALATAETDGFTKIVSDKKNQVVKGVFIVGAHASDLISEAALAVTNKLNLHDVANTIHPHPTLPESFMEAAEVAQGKAIHIFSR